MTPRGWHLVLKQRGVGDTVAATRLVADIRAAHPDARVAVSGMRAPDVFAFGPPLDPPDGLDPVSIDYAPEFDRMWKAPDSGYYVHMGHADFEGKTGAAVPRGRPLPEMACPRPEVDRPYWVMFAGVKWDMPLKQWPPSHFAEVVRLTAGAVRWVQVGSTSPDRPPHRHVEIPGTENALGATDLPGLFRTVAGASGVLTHLSLGLLLAGAFGVPCVALAGGREPNWIHTPPRDVWPTLEFVHSIGKYPCCAKSGCARTYANPVHREAPYPANRLCELPVVDHHVGYVGKCLADIRPADVAAAVLRLNDGPADGIMT